MLQGLAEAGASDIRQTHNAVLRHLDAEGTRASTLAARAGLTRQALTQIVDDLEALGYVSRAPDPGDRRAKLVLYTPRGRRAFAASRAVIERIEARHRDRLGERRYEDLRAALAVVARDDGTAAGR